MLKGWVSLVLCLGFSLMGCGQSDPAKNANPSEPSVAGTTDLGDAPAVAGVLMPKGVPDPADASLSPAPGMSTGAPASASTTSKPAAVDSASSPSQPTPTPTRSTAVAEGESAAPSQTPRVSSKPAKTDAESRRQWLEELVAKAEFDQPDKDNLKQIGLAMHNFHDAFNHFPALDSSGQKEGKPGLSWRVYLLPFLDQADLYNQFHIDEPWDSEHNKTLIEKMPEVYGKNAEGKTRYHVFTGKGTAFQPGTAPRIRNYVDGLSYTILVAISGEDQADVWTKPSGLPFDAHNPAKALGNAGDSPLVLWGDGSVSRINKTSPSLAWMIQHADGNSIPQSERHLVAPEPETANTFEIAPAAPLKPAPAQVATDAIPADALLVAVVQPRRIFAHPVLQSVLKIFEESGTSQEKLLDQTLLPRMKSNFVKFGIDPLEVEEVRLVIGADILQFSPFSGKTPAVLATIRTGSPYDEKSMANAFLGSGKKAELREVAGHSYLYLPSEELIFMPKSNQEILIGNERVLKKAFDPGEAANPSAPLLQRLTSSGNSMVLVAAEMTPAVREQTQLLARQAPPGVNLFMPYVTQLLGVSLAIDLNAPELIKLQAQFQKPELASGLQAMLDGQLASAKAQFDQLKSQIEQMPESEDKKDAQAAIPLLSSLVSGTKLSAEGDTVTFMTPRPENFEDLPNLLAPAIKRAQNAANANRQRNNLKIIGLAMHNFHDTFTHFPAIDSRGDTDAPAGLSWRVHILPFIDEAPLYNRFKLDEPWDSAHNKELIPLMPKIYGDHAEYKTRLHVLTGSGAPFEKGKGRKLREFTDGTSNTLMVVEAAEDTAEIWTKPTALTFDAKEPLKCLGRFGEEIAGFHAVLCDGSVRFISKTLDPDAFRKLVQFQDGEPLGDF